MFRTLVIVVTSLVLAFGIANVTFGDSILQRIGAWQNRRHQIKAMPLKTRPNRPGHFYGNNVRRVHHFRHGR